MPKPPPDDVYGSMPGAGIIDPFDALLPGTSFLAKPFEAETLSAAVEEALSWQTA